MPKNPNIENQSENNSSNNSEVEQPRIHNVAGDGLFNFVSTLWNDITGKTSQQKEFEQQEYLIDKQNEYNKPSNQVARFLEAGLNPNTVNAQSGNVSASPSPVANNTAGTANALNTIANAVTGISSLGSQVAKNRAEAGLIAAQTVTENQTREHRVNELKSIFNLNDAQASLFELQAGYYVSEASSRINLANAQATMFREQVEVFKQQIENYKKDIELIDKKIDSEGWLARMNEYNAYQSKWYYDTMNLLGFDPRNPVDSNMFSLAVKFGVDSVEYQRGLSYVKSQLEANGDSEFELFQKEQQVLYDNLIKQMDEYMKKELGNKYKGLPVDILNDLGKGFGIGLGGLISAKSGFMR